MVTREGLTVCTQRGTDPQSLGIRSLGIVAGLLADQFGCLHVGEPTIGIVGVDHVAEVTMAPVGIIRFLGRHENGFVRGLAQRVHTQATGLQELTHATLVVRAACLAAHVALVAVGVAVTEAGSLAVRAGHFILRGRGG